jgi:hypothetical protein
MLYDIANLSMHELDKLPILYAKNNFQFTNS